MTGIVPDQEWTFAANETYWQGRPKLDGIDYVYVDDAAVALEAYRAGDLDIVQLEPPQIPEVNADPDLSEAHVVFPQASTFFLQMNLNLEPFTDLKVREAFAYAFDRETHCVEVRGDCTATFDLDSSRHTRLISKPISSHSTPRQRLRLSLSPHMEGQKTSPKSVFTTMATDLARPSAPNGWRVSTETFSALT